MIVQKRIRRTVQFATIALMAAFVVSSCGIPLDSTPRAVSVSSTTPETVPPVTTLVPGPDTAIAFVYYLSNEKVVSLSQEVSELSAEGVLSALFDGGAQSTSKEIQTQIPTGTRLLGVRARGPLLTVDVSKEFDNQQSQARTQAIAQIVLTATELDSVESVEITIEGQPTILFSPPTGDTDVVAECDYVSLFPSQDVIDESQIPSVDKKHLTTRRNALSARCQTR